MALFVVERDFDEHASAELVRDTIATLTRAGAELVESYVDQSGERALFVVDAADEATIDDATAEFPGQAGRWSAWTHRVPDRDRTEGFALVAFERDFDAPVVLSELESAERRASWCLEQYNVKFLWHYVANDGRKMICFYDAPDAESVRRTQRTANMPMSRVWSASWHERTTDAG